MDEEQVREVFELFDDYTHMAGVVVQYVEERNYEKAKLIVKEHLNPIITRMKQLYNEMNFDGSLNSEVIFH